MHLLHYDPRLAREPVCIDGEIVLPRKVDGVSSRFEPEEGLPYFIDDDGVLSEQLDAFGRYVRADGVSMHALRSYSRDLHVFARFARQALGKGLLEVHTRDVASYRKLRLEGPLEYRLSGSSWRRASAALSRFYDWALNDAGLIEKAPKTRFSRSGEVPDATIKFVALDKYLEFRRQLGERSFENSLRNRAFAELLVTSGLRAQEANRLLLCELPLVRKLGRGTLFLDLPASITKGRRARQVPFSARVLGQYVTPYIREGRADAIAKWQASGGIRTASRPLLATPTEDGRLSVFGEARARKAHTFSLSERERLLVRPPGTTERDAVPALLWLTERGAPLTTRSWNSVFRRGSEEFARRGDRRITPHMLRHTFAVAWLTKLIKLQMAGTDDPPGQGRERLQFLYDKIAHDPLRRLQLWLGHAQYTTTLAYLTYVDEALELIELAGGELDADYETLVESIR